MDEPLIQTRREGDLAWVVFNRPERRNALSAAMLQALPQVMAELEARPETRVIIFRGAGERAFSAGGDIAEFPGHAQDEAAARAWHETLVAAIESVYRCPRPTLALVHGPAVGAGGEIALACDLRVAAEGASFGITGARLGFPAPYRNVVRLVSLLGPATVKRLLYTAELIPAAEALRLGLVDFLLPPEQAEAKALALAREIAARAPLALRAIKRAVETVVVDPGLATVADPAADFVRCFLSRDLQEGVAAFLEKRAPVFRGE